jgi:WD40 repeat protein
MVSGPFKGHTNSVLSVTFTFDGKRIASGSKDRSIRIWDAQTGKMVCGPIKGHTDAVYSVAFSPNGKQIASGSGDECICVWNAETGKNVSGPFQGHTAAVYSVAFSSDGKQIVSGSGDNSICVWHSMDNDTMVPSMGSHVEAIISIGNACDLNCLSADHEGWVCSEYLISKSPGPTALVFWVPHLSRKGLCGIDTLLILGTHTTRLDLSQFVHGTSWTKCYSPSPGLEESRGAWDQYKAHWSDVVVGGWEAEQKFWRSGFFQLRFLF